MTLNKNNSHSKFLIGDFNAKVGLMKIREEFMINFEFGIKSDRREINAISSVPEY